jgi:WD40 repeat protein
MIFALEPSPDGKTVAVGYPAARNVEVEIRSLMKGELIRTLPGHRGGVSSLSYSGNGKVLAAGGPREGLGVVSLWEVDTGQLVTLPESDARLKKLGREFPSGVVSGAVQAISLARDGSRLAVGLGHNAVSGTSESQIRIYDTSHGRQRVQLDGHRGAITSVMFDKDGATTLSGSLDGTARLWNVETGETIRQLIGHKGAVTCVSYSAVGDDLITGGADRTVRVWGSPQFESLTLSADQPTNIRVSPMQNRLATFNSNTITLWNTSTSERIRTFSPGGEFGAFSSDGLTFLSIDRQRTIRTWDVTTGANKTDWQLTKNVRSLEYLLGITTVVAALHPNDRWLAVAEEPSVQIWDLIEQKLIHTLPPRKNSVTDLTFSKDGKFLVTARGEPLYQFNKEREVAVWRVEDWSLRRTMEDCPLAPIRLAVSPNGMFIAAAILNGQSTDQEVVVWDFDTGVRQSRLVGFNGPIWSLAYSPDGKSLATGEQNGLIKLWDVANGIERLQLKEHVNAVHQVQFSPDNAFLASFAYSPDKPRPEQERSGDVRLWLAAPKTE